MDRKNIVLTDNKLINIHVSSQNMTYFIRIKTNEVNIDYAIDGGQVKVLILNDFMGDVLINDSGYVKNHGKLEITYIDLNKFNYNQVSHVDVYQDSILNITSKYLAINNKVIKMDYINREKYSEINIDNSCVALDNSDFLLECIGKIEKGAKASKNHQKSRCLIIDKPKRSNIQPILLIDENDVEASHSLSSGTIDQDVLYYLNSRGISYKQAMILLIHSYLLIDEEILNEYGLDQSILDELNLKVEEIYVWCKWN